MRRLCSCVGDPHCKPFAGNWFDIQNQGVYDLMELESGEKVEMATYTCRKAQPWSGGLSIKCNVAIAIRTPKGKILTVHKDHGATYDGVHCEGKGSKWEGSLIRCDGPRVAFHGKGLFVRTMKENFGRGAERVFFSLAISGARPTANAEDVLRI